MCLSKCGTEGVNYKCSITNLVSRCSNLLRACVYMLCSFCLLLEMMLQQFDLCRAATGSQHLPANSKMLQHGYSTSAYFIFFAVFGCSFAHCNPPGDIECRATGSWLKTCSSSWKKKPGLQSPLRPLLRLRRLALIMLMLWTGPPLSPHKQMQTQTGSLRKLPST